jgi:hypothetical protein
MTIRFALVLPSFLSFPIPIRSCHFVRHQIYKLFKLIKETEWNSALSSRNADRRF